jgi:hypothetical protein
MRTNLIIDLIIRGLGLLRLFLAPLILTTSEYGSLGLVSAYFLYANFADLGLQIHYEVISSMEAGAINHEIKALLKKLFPRLVLSASILAFFIHQEFHSIFLTLCSLLFVVTQNIETLYQIILRQQKAYVPLAHAILSQAVFLTLLIAPAALLARIEGVILLQAMAPLISIFMARKAVKKLTQSELATSSQRPHYDNEMTTWLLLGQVLMMIWLTCDRFFLSRTISIAELGLWNLGNMAGAVLVGYANTWGTLKLSHWKKEKEQLLNQKFLLGLSGIFLLGNLGLYLATKFFLKKYYIGLPWNLAWLFVMLLFSLVFIFDAFARSQMKTKKEARLWFFQKAGTQIMSAFIVFSLFKFIKLDPRLALCMGMISSFLLMAYFTSTRFKHD